MTTARDGWRYGLLGLPLAFAALPLYVHMPARYAADFGVPLAALGAMLLAVRIGDALIDPWIGRACDRLVARSPAALLFAASGAAVLLAAGFALLFFPPVREPRALLAWAAGALALTCAACSALTVAHQAWGARLAADDAERAALMGWREGFGLAGLLLASVLPSLAGWGATGAVLAASLALGCAAWSRAPRPRPPVVASARRPVSPLANAGFRRLLAVFVVNGTATAIPATLLLFFVEDRLQAPAAWQPAFLATYFLTAALSLPLWLRAVRRFGLARSWLAGMLLAVTAFVGASALGAGDAALFLAVCAASGLALGSDLALPSAMLAALADEAGEGAYFGWWQLAAKLNLALAAGLALPLLAAVGYVPGTRSPAGLQALAAAYCLLPCALKLIAALLLARGFILPRQGAYA